MAARLDAHTQDDTAPTGASDSFSHAGAADVKGVLVLVAQNTATTDQLPEGSVTYGGVNVPRFGSFAVTSGETGRVYGFFLGSGVPDGTQTCAWTISGTAAGGKTTRCITLTGNSDLELAEADGIGGSVANPTVTLATLADFDGFVAGMLHSWPNAPSGITLGANFTELGTGRDFGNQSEKSEYREGALGSDAAVDFTLNSGAQAMIAVAVREVQDGYFNTFLGTNGTNLSAQTSDSGHTHTLQSGAGTLELSSGELIATGSNNDAYYTASWTPAGEDQELTIKFAGHSGDNCTIDAGLHCQADGDGIWVQWETFTGDPGEINLFTVTGGGATTTTLDEVVPSGFGPQTIVVTVENDLISWSLNGVEIGAGFAVPAELQSAGLIGFNKFNVSSASIGVALDLVAVKDLAGGGGTEALAATPAGVGTVTAGLTERAALASSTPGAAAVSAALSEKGPALAAAPAGFASLAANLTERVSLAASVAGAAAVSADVSGTDDAVVESLAATVAGTGAVAAGLRVVDTLQASPAGAAVVTANLVEKVALQAAPAGQAQVAAALAERILLSGNVAGAASVTGNLTGTGEDVGGLLARYLHLLGVGQ